MTGRGPSSFVSVAVADGVGTIALCRPERRNALNMAVKRELTAALGGFAGDAGVGVIVVTGTRDYFVAGTDISEMVGMTSGDHARLGTNDLFVALRASGKILIAAVEGYALGGGCELALACDMIVAGETATFGQPEIRVGIMPGGGGTQAFARALGRHRAMKLLLTGEPVAARDALALGLVSEVVPAGEALAAAHALAQTVLRMPPLAVSAIRALVRQGPDMPIESALALERNAFTLLFDSADQKEGMRAFLEKRRPEYRGE